MYTIEEFINELRTQNTRTSYRSHIYSFFDWKYGKQRINRVTPEVAQKYESLAQEYLTEAKDIPGDLRRYAASMRDVPGRSAKTRMNGIIQYLTVNGLVLSKNDTKLIRNRLPAGGVATEEEILTLEKIRVLLQHSDVMSRALMLFLLSTGMRIGEALKVELSDIDLNRDPPVVNVKWRNTKTKKPRVTFLTKEAKEALTEWLKVRESYIQSAKNRNRGLVAQGIGKPKHVQDNRVFPFCIHIAETLWRRLLRNTGMDKRDSVTKRYVYRLHQFRKTFLSLAATRVPKEVVEEIVGHEGYLTSAYRRYTFDQLAEAYKQIEPAITVFIPASDFSKVSEGITSEIKQQKEAIYGLQMRNVALTKEVAELKSLINAIADNPDIVVKTLLNQIK